MIFDYDKYRAQAFWIAKELAERHGNIRLRIERVHSWVAIRNAHGEIAGSALRPVAQRDVIAQLPGRSDSWVDGVIYVAKSQTEAEQFVQRLIDEIPGYSCTSPLPKRTHT